MLSVLLSWIFSFVVFMAMGCLLQKILWKRPFEDLFALLLNGMFLYMIAVWGILFFTDFGWEFQWGFLGVSLWVLFRLRNECRIMQALKLHWRSLATYQKILLPVLFLLLLLVSGGGGMLPDNETYYIQTIKWANKQGFVSGLMNLHPFLGQFSGWHILQAGVNLSGTYFQANALNGFFFFWFVFFVVFDRQGRYPYWLIITGLFSGLFIFFTGAPSPDLAVWLLSLLIFDKFIENYNQTDADALLQITLLVFFSLLIKMTAMMNLFLLLILLYKHKEVARKIIKPVVLFGGISLAFWLSKNYILTGYLFYPLGILGGVFHPQWQYPRELLNYLGELGKQETLALSLGDLPGSFERWLFNPAFAESIFNPLMLILLLVFPLILYYKRETLRNYQAYFIIYGLGLAYFILILFISPNIRFFMPFLMFMLLVLIELIVPGKARSLLYFLSLLLISLALLVYMKISFTRSRQLLVSDTSKLGSAFSEMREGNLNYHSLNFKEYFWQTGDAPIPAAHYKMIEYFKEHFHYVPQRRGEGFFMEKINPEQ